MLPIALLVLTAAPLTIEPLGFTVDRAGDELTVTQVTAGSPAETAKLAVGDVITRVSMPMRPALRKPFSQLNDEDLVLTLTPPHGEPLVVSVKNKGTRVMTRTDAAPANPFPELPLPPEKLKRLTTMEQARYFAALANKTRDTMQAARAAEPKLVLSDSPALTVGGPPTKRFLGELIATAATPEWVHYRGSVRFRCESTAMTRLEFRGAPPLTLSTGDGQLHGGMAQVELPLWRVKDVLAACDTKQTELTAEVPLSLSCTGTEPLTQTLTATLKVTCDANTQAPRRLDALRISPERLQVGGDGRLEAKLWWDALVPAPKKVRVVQVLPRVEVLAEVPVQKSGETKHTVTVSTKSAAVLELAVEVEFADRSTERGPSQRVRVMSKEEEAADQARSAKASAGFSAVQARMKAKWPNPCAEPAKVVAWLKEQPEVTLASLHDGDFSYVIDFIPVAVHCH